MSSALFEHIARALPIYGCAALGGILAERSGVVHLGLEAIVLSSALGASMAALATGSFTLAALAALLVGACVGLLHGLAVCVAKVNDVVSGLALNLAALAGTRAILRGVYGSSANSPAFAGEGLSTWAWLGLVGGCGLFVHLLLGQTRFGLLVRAAGSTPQAVRSAGGSVARVRVAAVTLGSLLAGLAGLSLAFDQHQFQSGMSGGRGFVALVIGIVSRHRAPWALLFALVFALFEAADATLQGQIALPSELLSAAPYLATLIALALFGRRTSSARQTKRA